MEYPANQNPRYPSTNERYPGVKERKLGQNERYPDSYERPQEVFSPSGQTGYKSGIVKNL